jgi:hypothetical protein
LKSEIEGVTLMVLLFIVTFALGFTFGGSGLAGASGGLGGSTGIGKQTVVTTPPKFVFKAQGVNPADLYASSLYNDIPQYMLVPLVGLHLTILKLGRPSTSGFVRLPSLTLTTNASGIAAASVQPGNYEALVSGSNYALDTAVTLTANTTATLYFDLHPSAEAVSTLRVISSDTVSGVESTTKFYALLNYTSAPLTGFSELVGFETSVPPNGTVQIILPSGTATSANGPTLQGPSLTFNGTVFFNPQVELNATLLGSYPGTEGYWAVLSPSGSSSAYPSAGVVMFQFKPLYEVNYTAG